MAAAGTGHHPQAGSTRTGQRRRPQAESVLSKAQSSPTGLLILLVPSSAALIFVTSEASCSTEKRNV